jgi:general secretion pathway protein H
MRASAPPRGRAGFTLVEILVVVVIIAVVTSIAVLSVGVLGTDRGLDSEGERYGDVVAAALEQAQLEGRDYGLRFAADRYEVLAYAERRQRWESLSDDRLYAPHPLPAGVGVELEIEGKLIQFEADRPDAVRVPQVILYASGDASPYRLHFAREGSDAKWSVTGNADGTLKVTPAGAAASP